ncbi:carbohydrate kinase family protein [Clostridium botulinum]|uniref:carbohydrate kinase family protein n=1 Tax=Clostridium botulinum TaxID=1491 RepID=UPI000772E70D|nr:carbohydrate kinase [Clostridium botulinum]MBY6929181.1 carbohydrate kinase [Clostridium botulinum]NFG21309.1 carbohydrate kinase [Clostridium botulinum]NFO29034.1 carbohydrate kinase [Clostridium botulinum]NFO52089.1 carbohydrate kinase [Clostridium botulinum]NFO81358.1 carbohydrate kinase [Clostridium botulinum]
MFDVVAIGELLIDFTFGGKDDSGNTIFCQKAGGAPANVLAANSKLGGKTAFIGKVGQDSFGEFLKETLKNLNININGLVRTNKVNTTLAFVNIDKNGERSFSFYRNPGADMMLEYEEVNREIIDECNIFHFGSVSLTKGPSQDATLKAVQYAKQKGKIISYDPNYRPLLWDDNEYAKKMMLEGLKFADIIKVSEEELELLTGETDLIKGSNKLAQNGASLILISLGEKGSFYRKGNIYGLVEPYKVKAIDTNGAGDSFFGALHYKLIGKSLLDIKNMQKEEIEDIIKFANAAGAITTTRSGAIAALPQLNEVENMIL